MMMNNFMFSQGNPYDTGIKLEICNILNQYLDFKMDFYLNNLKFKFKEWTDKLELFSKIEKG
jgi:inositol 1,4,5-triphosphate receptor type 1/inositol 1,4,5-triphosphate receptor type 3